MGESRVETPEAAAIRAAAEATGRVIWAIGPDGSLAVDSQAWCDFTGLSREQGQGQGWWRCIHPEDRSDVERAWVGAKTTLGPFEVEFRMIRPTDRFTRVLMRCVPLSKDTASAATGWLASCTEVRTDDPFRRSEERLRLVVDSARVALWEFDFVAGQMTRTENHDALFGLPWQPVWTYDCFTRAAHPEDVAMADRAVQHSCAPGGPDDYAFDFRVIWPDESVHWLAVHGCVVRRDATGAAELVRGALIDVTRLKAVEAELRKAIHVREEFLQVASHELNTPITTLALKIGALRKVQADGALTSEKLGANLDGAERQVRRLADLVRQLLDVTHLGRGRLMLIRERVALADVARAVVARLAPDAKRTGCEVALEISDEARGDWDRDRLEQVLFHLLSNAFRYGSGKPVHVRVEREGSIGRLTVQDEGVGIQEHALPRVFEKFEHAALARGYGGLGLGLYIVRQLVLAHGGMVTVQSKPGEGATFRVDLPLEDGGE
jgi:PAS domain S-box-containing protein